MFQFQFFFINFLTFFVKYLYIRKINIFCLYHWNNVQLEFFQINLLYERMSVKTYRFLFSFLYLFLCFCHIIFVSNNLSRKLHFFLIWFWWIIENSILKRWELDNGHIVSENAQLSMYYSWNIVPCHFDNYLLHFLNLSSIIQKSENQIFFGRGYHHRLLPIFQVFASLVHTLHII